MSKSVTMKTIYKQCTWHTNRHKQWSDINQNTSLFLPLFDNGAELIGVVKKNRYSQLRFQCFSRWTWTFSLNYF
jgi:hypothetical protein